jgi:galactokinase/mevalonate kinase-like predicted kinase
MLYRFVEDSLYLIPLGPRVPTYSVLAETNITRAGAEALSEAAENCWEAILNKDVREFGRYFRASFEAQIAMFPSMVNEAIMEQIQAHQDQAYGWKLSGAGGGGYIIFVSDRPVANGFKIIVRREVD